MDKNKLQKIINIMDDKNIKYYDDQINTPAMKTIKAIIPYIDFEHQKQFAIMIKIIEIQMLNDMYSKKNGFPLKTDFESAIANALKIHMNKENMSAFKQALQIQNIFGNQKNYKVDENMDDILKDEAFKNLTDENKKLLNDFLRDISGKSPMESVNIIMEYNKKMPENISKEQKEAMVKALLTKMPQQKQQQFLSLYNMFNNK